MRRSKRDRKKWREDCWVRIFSLIRECGMHRVQSKLEESAMKQQQRMNIMKDLTKKTWSEGRTYAESRLCVSELLAADCEKAWIHPAWKKQKMRRERRRRGINKKWRIWLRVRKEVLDSCTKITELTAWRGGPQILKTRRR